MPQAIDWHAPNRAGGAALPWHNGIPTETITNAVVQSRRLVARYYKNFLALPLRCALCPSRYFSGQIRTMMCSPRVRVMYR
jgi:hypothetical protein